MDKLTKEQRSRYMASIRSKEYIRQNFKQLLGKVYTPFADNGTLSLALDIKDEDNNKVLLSMLEKSFYVERCKLGQDPNDVLPAVTERICISLPSDKEDKNVLTGLVRKTDDTFKMFAEHKAKIYIMEKIPSVNLMGIKYFLPMVGGMIDGYYDVERIAFSEKNEKVSLRIRLGEYHMLGDTWVMIYRVKMQPGELISLDYTENMYLNKI